MLNEAARGWGEFFAGFLFAETDPSCSNEKKKIPLGRLACRSYFRMIIRIFTLAERRTEKIRDSKKLEKGVII